MNEQQKIRITGNKGATKISRKMRDGDERMKSLVSNRPMFDQEH